jgi:serine protease Do
VRKIVTAFAVCLAALTGLAATTASAATPEDVCNRPRVVARALPAVVNITNVKVSKGEGAESDNSAPEQIAVFVGSGSVIDPSGVIITNKHVIQDAAMIWVTFNDRTQVPAQLIAAAGLVDLALLKVEMPHPLPTLRFADSDKLQVGQPVIAIGNPLGLGTSVSVGVVSALDRNLMRSPFDDYIQTDATINPGNSGGPLLNCDGEIAGVDSALMSNSKVLGSIGLGFAIPADEARFVAAKLAHPNTDQPNWIGVHLQDLTQTLALTFGRPSLAGAIVTGVDPGSPAAQAGLKPGDVIVSAGGHAVEEARAVLRIIVTTPTGEPIPFNVWRDGQTMKETIIGRPWPHLSALRSEVLASAEGVARAEAGGRGLHLTAVSDGDVQRYKLAGKSGVLVDEVTEGSEAESVGLKPGDVIELVGKEPATTPEAMEAKLNHPDGTTGNWISLLVQGESSTRWVAWFAGRLQVSQLLVSPVQPPTIVPAENAAAHKP